MVIDGHTLPCYFADGFCKPTTKTLFTLVWFSNDFCLIFTLQDFLGRMTKIEDRYWIETDSFVQSSHSTKPDATSDIKGTAHPFVLAPYTHSQIILFFHIWNYIQMLNFSVVNLTVFTLHKTLTFLKHTPMVS